MHLLKALVGATAILLAGAMPALAQYPGTTSTTLAPTNQTAGTLAVGAQTTVLSCGFVPGTVTVSLNGQSAATGTADVDGCVRTVLGVLSASQARVNGTALGATCTNNVISVSGAGRTVTTSFGIDCQAGGGGGLPRTGAMILRWSLAGGALLVVGALLVLSSRRRSSAVPG